MGITMISFAQGISEVSKDLLRKPVKVEYIQPTDDPVLPMTPAPYTQNDALLAPNETKLGETVYDLQSNASINNRFWKHDDGTMAAVWTRGIEPEAFSGRGTAYNYFDGTTWGDWPTERIEDRRCGWPNYAAWGTAGEVSVAHNGVEGLEFSWRSTKGSGDWTQQNFLGPAGIENDITWPRMITSGDDHEIVHLFVNSYEAYEGQDQALLYSRTNDGGATFDPLHEVLDGIGEADYFEISADDYVMAAKGNTVVMLVASTWNDLFFLKSEDNGDNWEKTVIWQHPYPFFDWDVTITDSFFCCDGSANVALDNDGKVHVVFGINRVYHDEPGTTFGLWRGVDGIGYWNEDMERFSDDLNALAPPDPYNLFPWIEPEELVVDYNYIGWMQDVDGDGEVTLNDNIYSYQQIGPSNMPAIHIDDDGYIHVLFVSTTETYEVSVGDFNYNYKHLWYRTTHPNFWGGGWSPFIHLTEDVAHIFDESYYPVISDFDETTSTLHYIFNTDITPGLGWSSDHTWQTNNIIHGSYMLPVGINEVTESNQLPVSVNPNPVVDAANFSITLDHSSLVLVSLTDLTGQKVRELNFGTLTAGESRISMEVSELPSGVYCYQVIAGKESATGKIIVK